jgi:hypothetical protein
LGEALITLPPIFLYGKEHTSKTGMEMKGNFYRDEGGKRDAHHRVLFTMNVPRIILTIPFIPFIPVPNPFSEPLREIVYL